MARLSLPLLRLKWRRFSRTRSVPRGRLCLDVGSGDAPWARADVLLDARTDDLGRTTGLIIDRPFVFGSLSHLPFRDSSFDYIHASHVLEHVTDPERAIAELVRVAAQGYIEVPTALHERLSPRSDHVWGMTQSSGALVFGTLPFVDRELSEWFKRALEQDSRLEASYWHHFTSDFAIELEWKSKIDYQVVGKPAQHGSIGVKLGETSQLAESIRTARRRGETWRPRLKRNLARKASPFRLADLLACPGCRGELTWDSQSLQCHACTARYPLVEGVPVLHRLESS